uniref:Caprin-2 n=1 Tax=Lepisosteus oculatus TaxID=7918 RepID=W5ND74_LEPOC
PLSSETVLTMVQLSPSPVLDLAPMSEHSEVTAERQGSPRSPTAEAPPVLSSLQLALASSAPTYQGYDTYIENGLICLKHKIRNIEKKKLKLEDYKQRLKAGEALNQDQLDAVEKYDEVVHNLAFARELQKTFSSLSQDLLKAQRKAVRREQVQKTEVEKKRLCTVLQVHYILQSLQQEHVRKDFRSGLNGAPFLSARELERLLGFSERVGCKRNESMSVEDQMEQAAIVYGDLLEGADKPVAGTTYKHLKEQLARLLDCGYFDHIPVPHSESLEEAVAEVVKKPLAPKRPAAGVPEPSVPLPKCEVPAREFLNRRYLPETDFRAQEQEGQPVPSWKAEFLALKQQEPPDSWDMEYTEKPASPPQSALKPWRAAPAPVPAPAPAPMPAPAPTPVPKEQVEVKPPPAAAAAEPKQASTPSPSRAHQGIELLQSVKLVQLVCFLSPHGGVQRRERKSRPEQEMKVFSAFISLMVLSYEIGANGLIQAPKSDPSPVAVFTSPSPLPADPELRKQKLQDLMEEIQGSFSFMQVLQASAPAGLPLSACWGRPTPTGQNPGPKSRKLIDSVLEGEGSPGGGTSRLKHSALGTSTPLESSSQWKCLTERPVKLCPPPQPAPVPAAPVPPKSSLTNAQTLCAPVLKYFCLLATVHVAHALLLVFGVRWPTRPAASQSCGSPFSLFLNTSFSPLVQVALIHHRWEFIYGNITSKNRTGNLHKDCFIFSSLASITFPAMETIFLQPVPLFTNSEGYHGTRLQVCARKEPQATGGFESYKNGMPSPGGNFIQPSYPARECTPILYGARESGFQQNYKRGGLTGQRASSRATWSDSSQVSSPERDNETFASVDSGQGDSRCITPIDVPVSAPGATLMPVHVYPLPQQMRVAFSAARTSNFAPGTLDQPIVFDLLLNNLGETFDMQLGRFSCPVNGTYVFIFHILKLAVNVPLYVNLMRNEEVMVSAYANDGAPDHETASNHAVLQLYQGDQIWLRLHRGAIYGSSWKYSTFSGYLLYQD